MSVTVATPARDKIDDYGLDAICGDITAGQTLTGVAAVLGVSIGSLLTWCDAATERSARVREARASAARLWDEKAESGIQAADEPFKLAKAKELAYHYRWRASKASPREYGDKLDTTTQALGKDGQPIDPVVPVLQVTIAKAE